MERINDSVAWYQAKIGAYDKQLWEKSVEQAVLKITRYRNIHNLPKKKTTVKQELIDVDLVRGSTFSKAKPQHGWLSVAVVGIVRAVFLPFYIVWWQRQTSRWLGALLLLLYALQLLTMTIYYADSGHNVNAERLSLAHLASPVLLMITLAIIHAQIVATHASFKQRRDPRTSPTRKLSKQAKRKKRGGGGGSHFPCTKTTSACDVRWLDRTSAINRPSVRTNSSSRATTAAAVAAAAAAAVAAAAEDRDRNSQCKCEGYISGDEDGIAGHKAAHSSTTTTTTTTTTGRKGKLLKSDGRAPVAINVDATDAFTVQAREAGSSRSSSSATADRKECQSSLIEQNGFEADAEPTKQNDIDYSPSFQGSPRLLEAQKPSNNHAANGHANLTSLDSCCDVLRYKPLDASETVTGNSQETGRDLTRPIEEFSGSLLLPGENDALLAGGLDFECEPSKEDTLKAGGSSSVENLSDVDYIPAAQEAEGGNINLIGIKHRRNSDTLLRHRHKSTSRFDQRDSEVTAPAPAPAPAAPASTTDDMFELGSEAVVDGMSADVVGGAFRGARPKCPRPPQYKTEASLRPQFSRPARHRSPSKHKGKSSSSSSAPIAVKAAKRSVSEAVAADEASNWRTAHHKLQLKTELEAIIRATGSSCESDLDTATPGIAHTASAEGGINSELDWDDTLNNADTTSTDTTTTSCSENDLSEEAAAAAAGEQESEDAGEGEVAWSQSVQHVNSVMNNLASSQDKVSCLIWEGEEVKKADLTVLDVGWSIIQKVDHIPLGSDYLLFGVALSALIMSLPPLFRAYHSKVVFIKLDYSDLGDWFLCGEAFFGSNWREILVVVNGIIQRMFLSMLFFFLLSVAERTFKQRLLYAKHFCYLTSSRRAKKYELPHFRLNKVRSIKTWLSLRSYLKKRGPQRSVDSIVSAAFFITIIFVSLMCIELLHDSGAFLDHLGNWELVVYCMALGVYMLRFITLGSKINKKYRNFSVLITEQINLYLRMEQKPDKKDELMLANNVLKLAEALLKELESPFKVSGLSANPFLYNVTKVVILSAFSAVLTELLGFKLKLYKIKIKA